MPGAYFRTMFGAPAQALQRQDGSREAYARIEAKADPAGDRLTERELGFLAARDSVYIATVTPDGWPYVQHRGGPTGFVKPIGPNRIAFADYPGNRQHITAGNLAANDRVALFCMDYPAQRRLKLIGRARIVARAAEPALLDALAAPDGIAAARAIVIEVAGFDWNCSKHITPRLTGAQWAEAQWAGARPGSTNRDEGGANDG